MAFSPTSPVTGLAQTGLTSPTYTIVADTAPDVNGKQYAVTALGGTQTGVTTHSGAAPFTATFVRPKNYKVLGKANPVTGVIVNVPMNVYHTIFRKGVIPLAGQPYLPAVIRMSMSVPAGSEIADSANIRALCSFAFGVLSQQSSGIGDTLVTGIS